MLPSLQFLEECIAGFVKSDYELKHLCLEYMAPWLPNLARFVRHDNFLFAKLLLFPFKNNTVPYWSCLSHNNFPPIYVIYLIDGSFVVNLTLVNKQHIFKPSPSYLHSLHQVFFLGD